MMTVAELIEQLKECDQTMEVRFVYDKYYGQEKIEVAARFGTIDSGYIENSEFYTMDIVSNGDFEGEQPENVSTAILIYLRGM